MRHQGLKALLPMRERASESVELTCCQLGQAFVSGRFLNGCDLIKYGYLRVSPQLTKLSGIVEFWVLPRIRKMADRVDLRRRLANRLHLRF
jgi:hypothetical protein